MNTYIARQPILDNKSQVYAYELLFRTSAQASSFTETDANQASSRVVMDSFYTMGLDTITGGKPAFVNFTASLLQEGVATLFPKELLVVEVLEDIEPTPETVEVCRELHAKGYTLALDDFVYRPELEPLIKLCSIIKFDFMISTPSEIYAMIRRMDTRGKKLLAEKIETVDMFNKAASMGCTLFQGYYFSKPVTLSSKEIIPLNVNYNSLLREAHKFPESEMDYGRLADIIQRDVGLTYKLLRMVNSAYYGMRKEVTDIKQALSILGSKEIRKWVYLMTLAGLKSDKPDELIRLSMIRGRFLENVCPHCFPRQSAENLFLTGLFSLIDVMLDRPMSSALAGILSEGEVYDALVNRSGSLYTLLNLVIGLERGEWAEVDWLASHFGISARLVSELYLEALSWCDDMPF